MLGALPCRSQHLTSNDAFAEHTFAKDRAQRRPSSTLTQQRFRDHKTVEKSSAAHEDVRRLTERLRKKRETPLGKAAVQLQPAKTSQFNNGDLLLFERQGHLLTRGQLSREDVHNLAKVIASPRNSVLHTWR